MLAGFSSTAIALQATRDIHVGLGAVASVTRHPAIIAMETATLANAYPGRFTMSIGHGPDVWTKQMGVYPGSILGAMRECLGGVRRLLDGETLKETGEHFAFETIGLEQPAKGLPLLVASVGPKTIELAGSIADGLVVSVLAGPELRCRGARASGDGDAERGTSPGRRNCRSTRWRASRAIARRPRRGPGVRRVLPVDHGPHADDRRLWRERPAARHARARRCRADRERMPDEWLDWLAICGEPDECVDRIRALLDAGASSVDLAFRPCRDDSRADGAHGVGNSTETWSSAGAAGLSVDLFAIRALEKRAHRGRRRSRALAERGPTPWAAGERWAAPSRAVPGRLATSRFG